MDLTTLEKLLKVRKILTRSANGEASQVEIEEAIQIINSITLADINN